VRADRLVSLVLLLQARGHVTAAALARELEVSVRTVYRDLAALSAAGVPVLAESGPGGGCRLLDGYRFPLRGLRPEEAEALLILGVPGALGELGLDAAAAAAHHKIRVTTGQREPDGGASSALVHLDMPRWFRSHEEAPHLRTLAEALRRHRSVAIAYQKAPAADVAGPAPAADVAGPAPAAERWSAEFVTSRPRLPVRLRASPQVLAAFGEVFGDDARPALDAAGPPDDRGWQTVTLSFEHELAAAHRLAGFGGQVEVLSPPSVRTLLVTAAQGILDRYGS